MSQGDPLVDARVPADAAREIAAMRIRGAALIGRTAAASLGRLAREAPPAQVRRVLQEAGQRLVAARPTAVSLRNAVNLTLNGLPEADDDLGRAVEDRARGYIAASDAARGSIAKRVAADVPVGATILTHCHSSLAVACLVAAHDAGRDIRVFADETRPWQQGKVTVRQLADAGVDVTFIVDSAAHHVMEDKAVDLVLVGADTVTADGALYNKVGTRAVALGAKALDVPFWVAAESHKFSPYSLDGESPTIEDRDPREVLPEPMKGVKVANPVFDRTDPALITRYITEGDTLGPEAVHGFVTAHFGTRTGWI